MASILLRRPGPPVPPKVVSIIDRVLLQRWPWPDLAVVIAAVLVFWLPIGGAVRPGWWEPVLLVLLAVGAVLGGRRPWAGFVLTLAATLAALITGVSSDPLVVPAWCLVRAAAPHGARRPGRSLLLAGAGAVGLTMIAGPDIGSASSQLLATGLLVLAGGWTLGVTLGRERAEAARVARAEAEAAGYAERLKLVGDVHDVVSHSVASITLTAGVGAQVTGDDPQALRAKLSAIEDLGRETMGELRGVLQPVVAQPTDPPAERPAAAGPEAALDLARAVLREGLANAARHAPGASCELRVDVRNASAADPGQPGLGVGLAGLRQRVDASGGSLAAGPDAAGGYRLAARIPVGGEPQ